MKKIILIVAVALTSAVASAQGFKKADNFVEGNISYSKSTGADASHSIMPTVGHFFTNRVAAGVFGEVANEAGVKTTGVGAFARCYFMTVGKSLNVYSQLDLGTSTTKEAGAKTTTTSSNLGIGANYFVSNRLSLNVGLTSLVGYTSVDSHSTVTVGFGTVSNPLNAGTFGLSYKF
jgi:outer membrane protein